MSSGYGDKADRIISDLEQRNANLKSEVVRLRRVERELRIQIRRAEEERDGSDS